ncbi:uncharacterized protein MYCFIDRAFT_195457 [Pseudocercospora fijiensis CIRAD86]|uniref:Uncharacterized protein n=1 Tax=Pseudocercospora fijiensis (strain CIRAD86) TaxID=383855 RepID=M2Z3K1_PSEFD|nr:uncharacterized protein MYCFIDRAFT_195457 [Pseudocercospora fijiensis CIRAD86]EME84395.1 hypothetical protein MYCFIDRAFT_195457 [Pseudocercospora fijiensis CIRAD86]
MVILSQSSRKALARQTSYRKASQGVHCSQLSSVEGASVLLDQYPFLFRFDRALYVIKLTRTMANTTIEFAWALQVDIATLGGHLEAYEKLQSTIATLRLCNRFGQGNKATIAKLPVELVQNVENFLLEAERLKLKKQWVRDLTCWEQQCRPTEHMSREEILECYNEWRGSITPGSWEDECVCECGDVHALDEFPESELDTINEILEGYYDGSWHRDQWCDEHEARIESWFRRTGEPTQKSRGTFDRLSSILSKHFGLETWITHVHEHGEPVFPSPNNLHSTKAYLRLPAKSSVRYDQRQDYTRCHMEPFRVKTEFGLAGALSLPPEPEPRSLARFAHACKVLRLSYVPSEPSPSTIAFENSDSDKLPDVTLTGKTSVDARPQMTMFVRSNDETEDW